MNKRDAHRICTKYQECGRRSGGNVTMDLFTFFKVSKEKKKNIKIHKAAV